jgi:hypothetical protein
MTAYLAVNVLLMPLLFRFDPNPSFPPYLAALINGAFPIKVLLTSLRLSLIFVEGLLLVVVVLRMTLGNDWIADALAGALIGFATGPPTTLATAHAALWWVFAFVLRGYVSLWLLRRFGLVAMWAASFAGAILVIFVAPNSWYAGRVMAVLVIAAAMASWCLWVILSAHRRPAMENAGS